MPTTSTNSATLHSCVLRIRTLRRKNRWINKLLSRYETSVQATSVHLWWVGHLKFSVWGNLYEKDCMNCSDTPYLVTFWSNPLMTSPDCISLTSSHYLLRQYAFLLMATQVSWIWGERRPTCIPFLASHFQQSCIMERLHSGELATENGSLTKLRHQLS